MTRAFRAWVEARCVARWGEAPEAWETLPPDGSSRGFFRVQRGARSLVAVENPGQPAENDAYWHIGRHLARRGVPVPTLHEYAREEGWLLLEDLGGRSLQGAVQSAAGPEEVSALYGPVLDALVLLQLRGCEGFDGGWCHQGARYDRAVMLERESGYFLDAFLNGYAGIGASASLHEELRALADLAGRAPGGFLLHRDFQSRNLLLPALDRPRIIDFQGARWGPLQYDVAALVMDPYVDLSQGVRRRVLEAYLDRLETSGAMSPDQFMAHYPAVALHRNLQILGAFAFLGRVRHKPFFLQWIPRALGHLRRLLAGHPEWRCPRLTERVEEAWERVGEGSGESTAGWPR